MQYQIIVLVIKCSNNYNWYSMNYRSIYICVSTYRELSIDDLAKINQEYYWKLFFFSIRLLRFCMVIRFFIPPTTANDLQLQRISISDFIYFIFVLS